MGQFDNRQYPGAQSHDSVNWQRRVLVTGPMLFKWGYNNLLTCLLENAFNRRKQVII